MLKQLLQASIVITGALVLSACNIDESFSTENVPVHSTGSQVTPGNASVGRSASQPGYDNVYNQGNVVTTTQQSNVVAVAPPANMVTRSAPVVTTQSAPVVTQVPVMQQEPAVRSTPSLD